MYIMATGSLAVYKTSHATQASSFFEYMPQELFREMLKWLDPISLRAFMETSKTNYNIVVSNIGYLVDIYSSLLPPTEQLMWSLFDSFENYSVTELFIKMLGVYKFANNVNNNRRIQALWEYNCMTDDPNYGPLPTEEEELYDIHFKTGILYGVLKSGSLDVDTMYAYSLNDHELFTFLYKLIVHHPDIYDERVELLEKEIPEFVQDREMTFEMFEERYRQFTEYNIEDYDIFRIILYNFDEHFIRLMRYQIPVEYAVLEVEEGDEYIEYSEEKLLLFNALRPIITDDLASHYILYNNDPLPENFLENVHRMLSIGIRNTYVIDQFLANPTEAMFMNIVVTFEFNRFF